MPSMITIAQSAWTMPARARSLVPWYLWRTNSIAWLPDLQPDLNLPVQAIRLACDGQGTGSSSWRWKRCLESASPSPAMPSVMRRRRFKVNHDTLSRKVDTFLRDRMEFYLREVARIRYDTARAILSPLVLLGYNTFVPSDVLFRAKTLERVRDSEDFLALAAAAKRTRNILNKSASAD